MIKLNYSCRIERTILEADSFFRGIELRTFAIVWAGCVVEILQFFHIIGKKRIFWFTFQSEGLIWIDDVIHMINCDPRNKTRIYLFHPLCLRSFRIYFIETSKGDWNFLSGKLKWFFFVCDCCRSHGIEFILEKLFSFLDIWNFSKMNIPNIGVDG